MSTSFYSIASYSFEFILMAESSLQECMLLLICWNCYNMLICLFCHVWRVHPMRLMSTCVLNYVMPSLQRCLPCIFVICMVTSTSLQSGAFVNADFRDLTFPLSPCLLLFCCHVNLMLQRDSCIFWRCSVRMFCSYCCNWSIPAIVCNFRVP